MTQALGLVTFTSNAELDRRDAAEAEREQEARRRMQGIESSLAAHIRTAWERNRRAKRKIQDRIIECLRQRNGEYDPQTLAEIQKTGGSAIFMMLTATKCRAAKAWLRDIMLPAGEEAWGLEPTPIPEVPPAFMAMIYRQAEKEIGQLRAAGKQPTPEQFAEIADALKHKLKQAAQDRAKSAAENMERLISDQLEEGRWRVELEKFIDDFVTFPAAILKGPIQRLRPAFRWGDGYTPVVTDEARPEFERISPFDIYPSPGAVEIDDGDLIEHVRFSRKALYRMIGLPGYKEGAIRHVLQEYGRGGLREWLWDDYERAVQEDRETAYLDQPATIDGLHYWGSAQGLMLLEWGVPAALVDDPLADYEIEAILIGDQVIRCAINDDPLGRRPYQKSCFQKKPGSWWGLSIPELMADIQRICNATARSLVNNMAISSGPQVEVYRDRLADGADAESMYPWKIWDMKSDPLGGASTARAINFFQPTSNAGELMAVYKEFELRADDATNIPRYAYGNERIGGAGATASGLSMLMESASKGIKDAIFNIDLDVVRPAIEKQWLDNMLNVDDDRIKGDCKVVARGASVLVAKDMAQAKRLEVLHLLDNPVGMQVAGVDGYAKVLREAVRGADLSVDGVIPDDETIKQRLKAQQSQPSPDERKADREDAKLKLDAQESQQELELKVKKLELDKYKADLDHREAVAKLREHAEEAGVQAALNANG